MFGSSVILNWILSIGVPAGILPVPSVFFTASHEMSNTSALYLPGSIGSNPERSASAKLSGPLMLFVLSPSQRGLVCRFHLFPGLLRLDPIASGSLDFQSRLQVCQFC